MRFEGSQFSSELYCGSLCVHVWTAISSCFGYRQRDKLMISVKKQDKAYPHHQSQPKFNYYETLLCESSPAHLQKEMSFFLNCGHAHS